MNDPFGATTETARRAAWDEWAANGPVAKGALPGGIPAWIVTGYAEARAALSDPRLAKAGFDAESVLSRRRPDLVAPLFLHMLRRDGADHQRLRRLINAAFTRRPMEALESRIGEIARELLDELPKHAGPDGVVDLVAHFAYPLPMTVICDLLGVPGEYREPFHELLQPLNAGTFSNEDEFVRAAEGLAELLRGLVALKRDAPAEDLITALVAARDGTDRLSEDDVTAMILLLVAAGHETTVNLLASGVLALCSHPEQLARLKADPALIGTCVEELLRFTSPVQATFPMIAKEEFELGGVVVPAGEIVAPIPMAANRDPSRIEHPNSLDIGREHNPHVSFGHGPHHCVGAPLARLEAKIALAALFERFPDLAVAGRADQLAWQPSFLFNALVKLPVRLA
ncbi:MAG: cytochrome P450 family protein [Sporichthyaceae bacterium]